MLYMELFVKNLINLDKSEHKHGSRGVSGYVAMFYMEVTYRARTKVTFTSKFSNITNQHVVIIITSDQ